MGELTRGHADFKAILAQATRCVANSIVAALAANSNESSAVQACQRGMP